MKKQLLAALLVTSTASGAVVANQTITVPDISVIGNVRGSTLKDMEPSFQQSIFTLTAQGEVADNIDANVVFDVNRTSAGVYDWDVREGYLTFSKLKDGLSAKVGRSYINFGKATTTHSEQWNSVDRPLVTNLLSGDMTNRNGDVAPSVKENRTFDGGELHYVFPSKMNLKGSIGVYQEEGSEINANQKDNKHEDGVDLDGPLFSARLAASDRKLGFGNDAELGISGIFANPFVSGKNHKNSLLGADYTLRHTCSKTGAVLTLTHESIWAAIRDANFDTQSLYGNYTGVEIAKGEWAFGVRLDTLNRNYMHTVGDVDGASDSKDFWSYIITKQVAENTKFRLQYTSDVHNDENNTVYFQFLFGLGKHAANTLN